MKKVLLWAFLLTLGLLPLHNTKAQEFRQFGTSFDCARTSQDIPTLVCNDPGLRRADLQQMQVYYVLRHLVPAQQQDLRASYLSRVQALVRECSASLSDQRQCVGQRLLDMRQTWLEELKRFGNQGAMEEALLDISRLFFMQNALKQLGYLPASSLTDGIIGSGTRDALLRFQNEKGLPGSGILTNSTFQEAAKITAPPTTNVASSAVATVQPQRNVANNTNSSSSQTSSTSRPSTVAPASVSHDNQKGSSWLLWVSVALGLLIGWFFLRRPKSSKNTTVSVTGENGVVHAPEAKGTWSNASETPISEPNQSYNAGPWDQRFSSEANPVEIQTNAPPIPEQNQGSAVPARCAACGSRELHAQRPLNGGVIYRCDHCGTLAS